MTALCDRVSALCDRVSIVWLFVAVGGLAAQLTERAGVARGLVIAALPGAHLTVTPLAWLVAISVVLVAPGLAGLRYRDIH